MPDYQIDDPAFFLLWFRKEIFFISALILKMFLYLQ
jgi:hypothetical protein